MDWEEIETELKNRPDASGRDADAFWAEFREKAVAEDRGDSLPEPIGFGRWATLVVAAAAIVAAVLILRPAPVEPTMRLASTEVKSVDVVASHGGVIIMTNEDAGGTVLWIADLDLNQTKEN